MVPPLDAFADTIKSLFNTVVSHYKSVYGSGGHTDYPINARLYEQRPNGKLTRVTVRGRITILVTGPWGGAPMADLRMENIPVDLGNGKGNVDFLITLPFVSNPTTVKEAVHVNRVAKFRGQDLNAFMTEFSSSFAKAWNSHS